MTRLVGLKIVLWLIALYHVILGVAAFISLDLTLWIAKAMFGVDVELTPQSSYIIRLLGVYVLVFGLLVVLLALDPGRHSVLLSVVVVLYICRILNKIIFIDLFTTAFGATSTRAWIDVAMLAAFGLAVLVLWPRNPAEQA
jgi:hypothetical protein